MYNFTTIILHYYVFLQKHYVMHYTSHMCVCVLCMLCACVQVRDTGPQGLLLSRMCGNSTPDFIQSKTNKMWIKMRTDYSNNGRGFHASYYASQFIVHQLSVLFYNVA